MDNSYLQYQGVNQVITWYHISILGSFCLLWVTRFPNHRNIPLSKLLPVSHCSFELHHLSSIIFQNRSIQQSFIDHQSFIIAFIYWHSSINHQNHNQISQTSKMKSQIYQSVQSIINQSSSSVIKIEHPQSSIKHH